MTPLFQHGDLVVRRNRRDERGTVQGEALLRAARYFYRVVFPSSPNPVQIPEGDLDKVTFEMSIEERLLNGEFGDHNTFSRLLTYERLRHPLQDTLYSLRASRTEFQAYQFKPLLKFLRSAPFPRLAPDWANQHPQPVASTSEAHHPGSQWRISRLRFTPTKPLHSRGECFAAPVAANGSKSADGGRSGGARCW